VIPVFSGVNFLFKFKSTEDSFVFHWGLFVNLFIII
jgi:hypothetical protein